MLYSLILLSVINTSPTKDAAERAVAQCTYPHEPNGWSYTYADQSVTFDKTRTLTIAQFPISAFTANMLPPEELWKLTKLADAISRDVERVVEIIRECLVTKEFTEDSVQLAHTRLTIAIEGGGYSDAIKFDRSLLPALKRSGVTLTKEQERSYHHAANDHERLGLLRMFMVERTLGYLFFALQNTLQWEAITFAEARYHVHSKERNIGGDTRRAEVRIAVHARFPLTITAPDAEDIEQPIVPPEPEAEDDNHSICWILCPSGVTLHGVSLGVVTPVVGEALHVFGPSALVELESSACSENPLLRFTVHGIGAYHHLPNVGAWKDIPPQGFWGFGVGIRIDPFAQGMRQSDVRFDVRVIHLERSVVNGRQEGNETLFAGIELVPLPGRLSVRGGIFVTRINAERQPNVYLELMYTAYQNPNEKAE